MQRKYDVKGAPFKIGEQVKVVRANDSTCNRYFIGRTGSVAYFEYDCGCGQTYPSDPMIGIRFKRKTAEFWKDELQRWLSP